MVEAEVGIVAIVVVFAIGLVVLAVVAYQVVQGKPVMAGYVIDGMEGLAAIPQVQIAGAGQPGGQGSYGLVVPRQKRRMSSR
jgi:hypothetical protein